MDGAAKAGEHTFDLDFPGFQAIAPEACAALLALGRATATASLGAELIELVKLRASQMNGCAFCVGHHLALARRHGVAAAKLDLVVAWRDAPGFSARERAALAWTEALTVPAPARPPAPIAHELAAHFSAVEIAHLTAAIGLINAWNRIGVAYGFPPPGGTERRP